MEHKAIVKQCTGGMMRIFPIILKPATGVANKRVRGKSYVIFVLCNGKKQFVIGLVKTLQRRMIGM